MILNAYVTLHARKVIIKKRERNSTEKTSKANVVFGFCLYFGDGVLFGCLKWSEAPSPWMNSIHMLDLGPHTTTILVTVSESYKKSGSYGFSCL